MVDGGEQPVFTRPHCERRGLGDAESGGDQHGNQENGAYYGDEQKGPPDRVVAGRPCNGGGDNRQSGAADRPRG